MMWLPDGEKIFDAMFIRVDTIHERDRQTHTHTLESGTVLTVLKNFISTGWLKLKYPTGQNAIFRQLCEIFTPKFLGLWERSCYNNSFLQSYGYINILCW